MGMVLHHNSLGGRGVNPLAVDLEQEVQGIFDMHSGLRESMNSTSTLGRQVKEEDQISNKNEEVFTDRTNMFNNPQITLF